MDIQCMYCREEEMGVSYKLLSLGKTVALTVVTSCTTSTCGLVCAQGEADKSK